MSKQQVKSFSVGDRVSWKSQAGGHWKTKTGTVVEVVPAFKIPRDKRFGSNRRHESYIVEVTYPAYRSTSAVKSVRQRKPERYWPLVRNLRLVKRGSTSAREEAAIETSVGTPVKVDRESFNDVKLIERGPNTEQLEMRDYENVSSGKFEDLRTDHLPVQTFKSDPDMTWKDVQDAERAIAIANSESTN